MLKKGHLYFLAGLLWLSGMVLLYANVSGNQALAKLTIGVSVFAISALPICIRIAENRRQARKGAVHESGK